MKAIVAVDLNWGIGYKGNLLQYIPKDMKFFKHMTLNKIIVMGRETFESLPRKEPLKDRTNIVLTKKEIKNDKIITCNSMADLNNTLKQYDTNDIFIIGGESVYIQLINSCSKIYVTKILNTYIADKRFVNLDENEQWDLTYTSELKSYNGIKYCFTEYINKNLGDINEFNN